MKNFTLLTLLLISLTAFAQKASIANESLNFVFNQIPNPLKIVVEGKKCNDFYVTTDNGEIAGNNCRYVLKPAVEGQATIFIYGENKKLINKQILSVKKFPRPVALFSNQLPEQEKYASIEAATGLRILFNELECSDLYFSVRYNATVIRNDDTVFRIEGTGMKFPVALSEQFRKLEAGDLVLIYDISVEIGATQLRAENIVYKKE